MALTFDDTQAAVLLALLGLPEDTEEIQLVVDTVKDATRDPMLPPPPDSKPSEIAAAAAKAKVETSVDDAINRGKITAARRKHWVSLIKADPGMADVLAAVPDETAVPLTEIGHGLNGSHDDLAERGAWFY